MHQHGLISNYTKTHYKPRTSKTNQAAAPNLLNREFERKTMLDVIVSDLTYIKVGPDWAYLCLAIDLWNREIIGWSVSRHKTAQLVRDALYSIPYPLDRINIFHSDRGSEFGNQLIDEVLAAFSIQRSLSAKGCPYDNAVIEATNHILKTEFIYQHRFQSLAELRTLLADYIHWYNTTRTHSSIGYLSPVAYRQLARQ